MIRPNHDLINQLSAQLDTEMARVGVTLKDFDLVAREVAARLGDPSEYRTYQEVGVLLSLLSQLPDGAGASPAQAAFQRYYSILERLTNPQEPGA